MEKITIRQAIIKDAKRLIEIYAPYVTNTAITFEYTVPTLAEFSKRIETTLEKYPYLVAILNNQIVGYAYTSALKNRAAYDWAVETSIYVDWNYKGLGIGKALYLKLEEISRLQHVLNMNACIAYPNPGSIAFHEKLGYQKIAHFHQCGYKLGQWYDMIWMEKMLGEHCLNPEKFIKYAELKMEVEKWDFLVEKAVVDLQQVFKDKYKDLNQTVSDANREVDFDIQISLLELAYQKYNDLLDLIDQGADFDKEHFITLQKDLRKQIDLLKGLEDEN